MKQFNISKLGYIYEITLAIYMNGICELVNKTDIYYTKFKVRNLNSRLTLALLA